MSHDHNTRKKINEQFIEDEINTAKKKTLLTIFKTEIEKSVNALDSLMKIVEDEIIRMNNIIGELKKKNLSFENKIKQLESDMEFYSDKHRFRSISGYICF